jgi:hypothetical protein
MVEHRCRDRQRIEHAVGLEQTDVVARDAERSAALIDRPEQPLEGLPRDLGL